MKRIIIIALLLAAGIAASAQSKKVSVLGDSYSTYDGVNPPGYAPFYPNNQNDCKLAEQCWWSLYTKAKGYTLEKNDSWGGTTICTTGYGHRDVTASSMLWRFDRLGDPDIIFLFGGTTTHGHIHLWENTSTQTGQMRTARASDLLSHVSLLVSPSDTLRPRL